MVQYYDGTKLLSLNDIDGNKPEIYIVTSNRTAGKTTYFSRMLFKRAIQKDKKFMLVYRYKYELDNCADKFFKDINTLFFPEYTMKSIKQAQGIYHDLYYTHPSFDGEWKHCGYAVALNSADQIKKNSHLFSDTDSMMFDEFQSETNNYCTDEVTKFISLHTSIARGQGKMVRYLPVYMIGNPVTILNPYYVELGISSRLTKKTKFLKGSGFVMEQGYNESAYNAQKESGFSAAFSRNKYNAYAGQGVYLQDNMAFVDHIKGEGRYLGTLKYKDVLFGLRAFDELGVIYCDKNPDYTYPHKLAITTEDHQINYIMLKRSCLFVDNMRYYFDKGCFRFYDLQCKEACMAMLCYV